MFGDPTINPKGLKKNKLGKLLKVKSGKFLPSSEMDAKGQYPVYGGNGINGFHSRYMFEHPMIVLGRVGAYCGATYYTKPKCWVTDNALYVAEHSEELHPRYLTEALRIANLNQYAGRAGQPLISGSRIYPIEILVPDMIKQEIFVKNIESIVKYEKQREETEKYLQDLFSTLNHHAFSGDLTAKWRDAHMKELLAEMEIQKKHLNTKII
jgi:type I restriction enzyme S subunit